MGKRANGLEMTTVEKREFLETIRNFVLGDVLDTRDRDSIMAICSKAVERKLKQAQAES